MSFIEGIGDDLLTALAIIIFTGLISLAWVSTHVNPVQLSRTFIIERRTRRRNEDESDRASSLSSPNSHLTNEHLLSPNETSTEHESDNDSSEVDEFATEQTFIPTIASHQSQQLNPNDAINSPDVDQSLTITIKFLNETQKTILANANDTISKIKRLHFADELSNNKIIRLIYQGRELQDSETLRTYNIRHQTTIHCLISTRRHSTSNQTHDGQSSSTTHLNSDGFDASFIDTSPITISSQFLFFLTLILGSIWYLRIKYRVLFTPISTIILILITIIFLIFTFGPLLSPSRRSIIPTRTENVHLD